MALIGKEEEKVKSGVAFKDGTLLEKIWNSSASPARALTVAVREAEEEKGKPHVGAWLYL